MGSDISKREKSKKSTIRSSVRKLKIQAEIEAHEKLDKIEEEKEKIKLQRLKRMQRKIMLDLELKNRVISDESESNEEKSNIIFDEVESQFKYNQYKHGLMMDLMNILETTKREKRIDKQQLTSRRNPIDLKNDYLHDKIHQNLRNKENSSNQQKIKRRMECGDG
ncbi:hypothetical protein JTB14_035764 [Gonioctena quinquepunctata]|nr:hypothetical protein JTB14_035764 [Gonioctena quinquepunctata]